MKIRTGDYVEDGGVYVYGKELEGGVWTAEYEICYQCGFRFMAVYEGRSSLTCPRCLGEFDVDSYDDAKAKYAKLNSPRSQA